jgi:poly-gamma-glutamate system protein
MKKREGRISILSLLIVTSITILLMIIELNSKTRVEARYYDEKLAAAETAQRAFRAVKNHVFDLGITIDRINDPNETGIIGIQYSPITTERGDLEAKLTSTNPNYAALIVELIKDAGVKRNDLVAVSQSGSYPGLNVNTLSALEVLGLQPVIITSISSSMWGANYPQLTYLDMESMLIKEGIFNSKTTAASLGGEDDLGRGLSPAGREIIVQAALRNNVPLLDAVNLDEMIERKMSEYNAAGKIKLFINVGETTTALAGTEATAGRLRPRAIRTGKGLVARFSSMGLPVVNLLDIDGLAKAHGLATAPIPLPNPGEGRLYYEYKYSVTFAVIATVILVIILFILLRFDIDYYLKRRKNG